MGNPVSVRTVWDCCAICGTRSMGLHGVRGATPEEAMDQALESVRRMLGEQRWEEWRWEAWPSMGHASEMIRFRRTANGWHRV